MGFHFRAVGNTPPEQLERNKASSARRGLPSVTEMPRVSGALVVVGGAVGSRAENLSWLQEWRNDLWAINAAWRWCVDYSVPAFLPPVFYTIDALYENVREVDGRLKRAVLAWWCHPSLFDACGAAETYVAEMGAGGPFGPETGPASSTIAPRLAIQAGYQEVFFVGCECSYRQGEDLPSNWVAVQCDGEVFFTKPDFLVQATALADVIRSFPHQFKDRSGGLLGALIKNPDHKVVMMSNDVTHDVLRQRRAA